MTEHLFYWSAILHILWEYANFFLPYCVLNFSVIPLKQFLLQNGQSDLINDMRTQKLHIFTSPIQSWVHDIKPSQKGFITKQVIPEMVNMLSIKGTNITVC